MRKLLLYTLLWCACVGFAHSYPATDPALEQLKTSLALANHDTLRMVIYTKIGSYFADIRADSAFVYIEKAERLALKYPDYTQSAELWNNIGVAYRDTYMAFYRSDIGRDLIGKSISAFTKSTAEAKRWRDEKTHVYAWFNLNMIYNHMPDKYTYFKSSLELINFIEKKGEWKSYDTLALGLSYKNLCISLDHDMGSKRFDEYLNKYKALMSNLGNHHEKIRVLSLEQKARSWTKADEQMFLSEYQSCKKSVKTPSLNEEIEHYLALYYFMIQDYRRSFRLMEAFSPSPHQSSKLQNSSLGIKYMIMGQSAYMLGRNQAAIKYLNKALYFISPVEQIEGLRYEKYTTLLYLSRAYKKEGNYKKALSYTEQSEYSYKDLHNIGIQAMMAENDVYLEELKQEKKILSVKAEILVKEQEARFEKKQKKILFVCFLIALLGIFWVYLNYRKTQKLNLIISRQSVELDNSNQLKDKILALLSHDLHSAINRIMGNYTQTKERDYFNVQSDLKIIQDILNNVLYWANMQLKKAIPIYTAIPLQALTDSIIDEYQYSSKEKAITILNTIQKNTVVSADENYLKIVLRNILSNAIKFTEPEGYIQVACQVLPQKIEIIIKDTGIGIEKKYIDGLFNLPVPSKGTKHELGTGLGLTLSSDIMARLGGSIELKSTVGKGTIVVISVPK